MNWPDSPRLPRQFSLLPPWDAAAKKNPPEFPFRLFGHFLKDFSRRWSPCFRLVSVLILPGLFWMGHRPFHPQDSSLPFPAYCRTPSSLRTKRRVLGPAAPTPAKDDRRHVPAKNEPIPNQNPAQRGKLNKTKSS